jgi:hypothetical protein
MTETEWQTSLDPDELLDCARKMKRLTARKGRLFGCGCFRLVWDQVQFASVMKTVEMAEARADLLISEDEMEKYRYPSGDMNEIVAHWLSTAVQSLAIPKPNPSVVAHEVRTSVANDVYRHARRGLPCRWQADLVREVIGNPFQKATLDPGWRTSDVTQLAHAIYEERAFERMPILADALMDAGCDDDNLIGHCRWQGPHVRGCWVVDLVLGKK